NCGFSLQRPPASPSPLNGERAGVRGENGGRHENRRKRASSLLLLTLVLLSLCHLCSAASLEISIRPCFAGQPLLLDSLRYKNSAGETFSVTRLSYLLSGFALERPDGSWMELSGQYAWMDAAQRRAFIHLDGVPSGAYRGIRFHIGPDAEANEAKP